MADQPGAPPVTPPNKKISSAMDIDSPIVDTRACTPDTATKLKSLKRKASQMLEESAPKVTSNFLKWRQGVVECLLQLRELQRQACDEGGNTFTAQFSMNPSEFRQAIEKSEAELNQELLVLLGSSQTLMQDLNDQIKRADQLEDLYIDELRLAITESSSQKLAPTKSPMWDRKKFRIAVREYLGTSEDGAGYCHIMGKWFDSKRIKIAHIVPFAWNTREMAHMFGTEEPPLNSVRNGLSLHGKLEEAFDNCWIAIVPDQTVESVPTEWKVVLLNKAIREDIFYCDTLKLTDQKEWRFRDIDGRRLTFLNDNRPARRFLYLRYALAYIHADVNKWPDFKQRVPSGTVWATPSKPDGYLRESVLLSLGKRIGDRLPKELIQAGMFDDPETNNATFDRIAAIRAQDKIEEHLKGERDPKEDDHEEGESSNMMID